MLLILKIIFSVACTTPHEGNEVDCMLGLSIELVIYVGLMSRVILVITLLLDLKDILVTRL